MRALGKLVRTMLLWGFALLISAAYHVRLDRARPVVRDLLNHLVSSAVLGELAIGEVSWIGGLTLIAHDVTLRDPDGRSVLFAERVRLSVQPYLPGQRFLVFKDASVQRGVLHLHPDSEEGLPSLITALTPVPDDRPEGEDPLLSRLLARALPQAALVEQVEFQEMSVRGSLLDLDGIVAERVAGRLRIDVDREFNLVLRNTRGVLSGPFPFTATFKDAFAHFSSREQRLVEVHADASRGPDNAHVDLWFGLGRGDAPQLDIQISSPRVGAETLTGLGFEFLRPLAVDLNGELTLAGNPAALQLDGLFDSRAGVVTLGGQLGATNIVTLESGGLYLGDALAQGPPITVAGQVEFELPAEEAQPIQVRAHLDPTRISGLLLPSATVTGLLTDDAFELQRLTAKAKGARLHSQGRVAFKGSSLLQVSAHFDDIQRDARLRTLLPNAAGTLDADLKVRISDAETDHRTHIFGTLRTTDLTYADVAASRLTVDVDLKGDLRHPTLTLSAQAQQLRYGGYLLGDGRAKLSGGPRSYQLSALLGRDHSHHMGIHGALTVLAHGFKVSADRLELLVGDSSFRGSLDVLEVVHGKSLHVGQLLLASRSQRLEASGTIRDHGEDTFLAELQDFDLTVLSTILGQPVPLQAGRADVLLQITGDVQSPRLLVQGALRSGRIYDVDRISAVYLAQYADGAAEIDGEVELGHGGVIRVLGDGELNNPLKGLQPSLLAATYEVSIDAADVNLTQVPQLSSRLSSGQLGAQLTLSGTVERPNLNGTLLLRELGIDGEGPFTLTTDVRYDSERLRADSRIADPHGPLVQARLEANLGVDRLRSLPPRRVLAAGPFVFSGRIAERRSDTLPFGLLHQLPLPLVGSATFELRKQQGPLVGYAWFEADPAEAWMADEGCPQTGDSPHLRGSLSLGQARMHFESALTLGQEQLLELRGSFGADLTASLERGAPLRLNTLQTDATVNIQQIERVPYLCSLGTGAFDGTLAVVNGMSPRPQVNATVRASFFPRAKHQTARKQIEIHSCESEPATANLELRGDHERAALTGQVGGCGGGPARLSLFLPLRWEPSMVLPQWDQGLPLLANLKFTKTQLKPLLDRVPGVLSASAVARGSLQVQGLPAQPEYLGTIHLNEGQVELGGTGQRLEDLVATLTFHGQQAELTRFSARADDGRLGAKGTLRMIGLLPRHAQLAVKLAGFPIRQEGHRLAFLSGAGALETDIGSDRARTAVALHTLAVRLPDEPPQSLQGLQTHPDVSVVEEQDRPPPETPYPLEFQVTADSPVLVQRNDFEVGVRPSLAVYYADPELRVGGFIEFRRGTFEVFGKSFEIARGNLRFDGGTKLNPEVNLTATHRVPTTRDSVTVQVGGRLSAPDIRFQSDACPGQSGALTLLFTGGCADDPGDGSERTANQVEFASGLLQGILTLGARQELGGLIPNLAVESGQRGYATRVRAGIESRSLVPEFMRPFIQKVYLQGAVSAAQTDQEVVRNTAPLDFLIELYFPSNIVGSGHFAPDRWGLDVTWQP